MVFKTILIAHIIAGVLSIILFWVPAFAKKGGKLHVVSGKIYVYSMWTVVVSAMTLCIMRIFSGHYETAMFLGFLALITAKPLWLGMSILRPRTGRFWQIKKTLEYTILLGGGVMIVLGILWWGNGTSVLMLIFGSLGLTALSDIKSSHKRIHSANMIQTHMSEMITSGIAAYTAFLAFGARQFLSTLLSGYWQVVPWILPTIIGVIAIRMLMPYYGGKKKVAVVV